MAAIYLWGYVAEMTVKAAYFAVVGFADTQHITLPDLHAARLSAPHFGVAPFGNLHDIRAWAELLVATRASLPGHGYAIPGFGNTVVSVARRVHGLWRETLRYQKNVAYEYELSQVQTALSGCLQIPPTYRAKVTTCRELSWTASKILARNIPRLSPI